MTDNKETPVLDDIDTIDDYFFKVLRYKKKPDKELPSNVMCDWILKTHTILSWLQEGYLIEWQQKIITDFFNKVEAELKQYKVKP